MGDGVRGVPAEDAVHHDEEVVGRVGLDGVAPDIDPVGRRLHGAHLRRVLAAHGHRRLDGPLPAATLGGVESVWCRRWRRGNCCRRWWGTGERGGWKRRVDVESRARRGGS
jgi:hypothetical protein